VVQNVTTTRLDFPALKTETCTIKTNICGCIHKEIDPFMWSNHNKNI